MGNCLLPTAVLLLTEQEQDDSDIKGKGLSTDIGPRACLYRTKISNDPFWRED